MRPQAVDRPGQPSEVLLPAESVKAHLENVLASPSFSGAWRQQRLLRYLVERTLDGHGSELKEYCLGLEVFDKGEGFDPRLDPIVRVEVSRLRTRLKKYYDNEGQDEPVRIVLPRGSYVPTILPKEQADERPNGNGEAALHADAPLANARPWKRGWTLAAALGAVLGLGWMALRSGPASAGSAYDFSRITREQARCNTPSLSPDGRFLVYARQDGRDWDIFLRGLGDEESRNLTPGSPADDRHPALSPDGKRVAFRSERDGGGIFLLGIDGGALRRIAGFGYHPSWSPDGNRLVFSSDTFAEPEDGPARRASVLYIADLDTSEVRPLTSPDVVYDAVQPAWSPHGHRIAFWGSGPDGRRDLWTVPAGGAPPEQLRAVPVTQDDWLDWSPAWSPNGDYLYFASDRDGAMNIWRIRIDEQSGRARGSPEPVRTPSTYSAYAALSAGGGSFVYVRRTVSSTLHIAPFRLGAPVSAAEARRLTATGRQLREPEPSPEGAWLTARIQDPEEDIVLLRPDGTLVKRLTNDKFKDRNARWSPEGRRILFLTNRSGKFEYWLMNADGTGLSRVAPSMPLVWAPDGKLIGYPADGNPYCLDPPGAPCPLAAALPQGFQPLVWSPDGKKVVGRLRSLPPPREQLFVYSLEDRSSAPVSEHGFSPVWLKDSATLLFWEDNRIWSWQAPSGRRSLVLDVGDAVLQQRFTLLPDQKSLLFVLTEVEEDIWLAKKR